MWIVFTDYQLDNWRHTLFSEIDRGFGLRSEENEWWSFPSFYQNPHPIGILHLASREGWLANDG